jgi:acyl transferase domain-containing protein
MLAHVIAAFNIPFFNLSKAEARAIAPHERLVSVRTYLTSENVRTLPSKTAGPVGIGVWSLKRLPI